MSCEHKGMMGKLNLVAAPISIRNYMDKKEEIKDIYNKASLYLFCRRKPLKFENIIDNQNGELSFDIVRGDNDTKVSCKLNYDKTHYKSISFIGYKKNSDEKNEIGLTNAKNETDYFSPEDLLWNKKIIGLNISVTSGCVKDILIYNVLYVGETVKQGVGTRIDSHHALLKILACENIVEQYDKAYEIVVLAFEIETFDAETHDSVPDKILQQTDAKICALDIEQAFINIFKTDYNKTKYKAFPDKNDLLAKGGYDTIIYAINEDIVLQDDNIQFVGDSDDMFSPRNAYSFLLIQNGNMTAYYPERHMMASIKVKGKFVTYAEEPMK